MSKGFIVSGFVYSLSIQQILLEKISESSPQWSLFSEEVETSDNPSLVFQKFIQAKLKIKVPLKNIYSVYDYSQDESGKNNYIVYAEVDEAKKSFKLQKGNLASWFTFKQLSKISISKQAHQDIIIGQRVINALARSLEAPVENPS